MKRHLAMSMLALAIAAPGTAAQGLPFKVVVIDWESQSLTRQQVAYRNLPGDREVLFCVESWKTTAVSDQVDMVTIEKVRLERGGGANRISNVGASCMSASGEPLPMFHTHTDGNCQFSPNDLVTVVARRAAFEGIQCGPRHFAWAFAWQVLAVANAVERETLTARPRVVPP